MEIGKMVPAHHELPRKLSGLQCVNHIQEAPLVALNFVCKTALQGIARMIESLLSIAHAVEHLTPQRARATIDLALEINDVRDNQFGGSAGGRRTQVCDEIANGEIDFVTDGRDDWQRGMEYRARDDLFIELPQIFDAPSTACDYDQID